MATCEAMYEPGVDRARTHTCYLAPDHEPPHVCPMCHRAWSEPGGKTWGVTQAASTPKES